MGHLIPAGTGLTRYDDMRMEVEEEEVEEEQIVEENETNEVEETEKSEQNQLNKKSKLCILPFCKILEVEVANN